MFIAVGRNTILIIHDYVVTRLIAVGGINYAGMIQGTMDRAMTEIYGEERFPTVLDKAGSVLYSMIRFHPFTDGCKRTGLLTAYLLLMYNGYTLNIPEDSAAFLEAVADLKNPNRPSEKDVINWIKKHARKDLGARMLNFILSLFIRRGLPIAEYTRIILERGMLPSFKPEKFVDTGLKDTQTSQ